VMLDGANLQGANLQKAHMNTANLDGAHLVGTSLRDTNFQGVYWTDATVWPKGWIPPESTPNWIPPESAPNFASPETTGPKEPWWKQFGPSARESVKISWRKKG
jgi:hypothetical protein